MLRPFFAAAMLAPGRHLVFRQTACLNAALVAGLAFAAAHRRLSGETLGYLLLVLGLVEGAALIGWRLTQMPKSQALEFLLTSPVQPRRLFLAEALVGVGRFALAWLGGLPPLVGLVFAGVVGWDELLPLGVLPLACGVAAGLGLTAWVYEPPAVRRAGEVVSLGGVVVYLVVGVVAAENLPVWLATLPGWLGSALYDGVMFLHTMNPFGVVRYWFAPDRAEWLARQRFDRLTLAVAAVALLAGARGAVRLRGHFHDRHYRPLRGDRPDQVALIGDAPLSWWAVRRVMEYSGRVNLLLAVGFCGVYAAFIVAGDHWPAWMGKLVFQMFEGWGGPATVGVAMAVMATVPAAFQFGFWDATVPDRCARLELLLLTGLEPEDYWRASLRASWVRGRGYLVAAGLMWLALGVSGRNGWPEAAAAAVGGLVLWAFAFAVGFRAFATGNQTSGRASLLVLGVPMLLFGLVQTGRGWLGGLLPPGLAYAPLAGGFGWPWAAGLLLAGGSAWRLTRLGLGRCDADLRAWYDANQGAKAAAQPLDRGLRGHLSWYMPASVFAAGSGAGGISRSSRRTSPRRYSAVCSSPTHSSNSAHPPPPSPTASSAPSRIARRMAIPSLAWPAITRPRRPCPPRPGTGRLPPLPAAGIMGYTHVRSTPWQAAPMPIPISCPHCQRAYRLKDELAGKTVKCQNADCRRAFPVPVPKSAAEVEAAALKALADEPDRDADDRVIAVTCEMCEYKWDVAWAMQGKNVLCPDCRHRNKVPMQKQAKAADWKTGSGRPSLARVEELEGVVASTDLGRVSGEALRGAGVVRIEYEARPVSYWLLVAGLPLLAAAVVLYGVFGWSRGRSEAKVDTYMATALKDQEENKDAPLAAPQESPLFRGALAVAAGEYFARQDDPARLKDALGQFARARQEIDGAPASAGRTHLLAELAVAQLALGGTKEQYESGTRIRWAPGGRMGLNEKQFTVQAELTDTIAAVRRDDKLINLPDRQLLARRLVREAVRLGQPVALDPVVPKLFTDAEAAEGQALAALEGLKASGDTAAAKAKAEALAPLAAGVETKPYLQALAVLVGPLPGLNNPAPPPPGQSVTEPARLTFSIVALVNKQPADALDLAARGKAPPTRNGRAQVLALIAEWADDPKDAAAAVTAAADIVAAEGTAKEAGVTDPTTLARLAAAAGRAGLPDKAEAFVKAVGKDDARAWAAALAVVGKLTANPTQPPDEAAGKLPETEKDYRSGVAWQLLHVARQTARATGSAATSSSYDRWGNGQFRPFGYAGLALGLQDAKLGLR